MGNYALFMHIVAAAALAARRIAVSAPRARLSATHIVRPAVAADVEQIATLVDIFAARRLMLPRTSHEIALDVEDYVVAVNGNGRLIACAALDEYSPSLAEISSVAVSPSEHGRGLGSAVVLGVERVARQRGVNELFALTLADDFFAALGYEKTSIAHYPEKLARYDRLRGCGVQIVEKSCFRKIHGDN